MVCYDSIGHAFFRIFDLSGHTEILPRYWERLGKISVFIRLILPKPLWAGQLKTMVKAAAPPKTGLAA